MPKKPTRADLDLELILKALEAGRREVKRQIETVRVALAGSIVLEALDRKPPVRKKHAHRAAPEPVDKRKSAWTPARRRAMARKVTAYWVAKRAAEKKRTA